MIMQVPSRQHGLQTSLAAVFSLSRHALASCGQERAAQGLSLPSLWNGQERVLSKVRALIASRESSLFLCPGIIEKSCGDGQKTYYADLETAMRKYITDHRTEFLPEGVDPDAADQEAAVEEAAINPITPTDSGLQPTGPKPVAASRGLQWALDTTEATWKVTSDSLSGLLDILSDLVGNLNFSGTTVLSFIIVLLVISNVYTILTMGERRETGRRAAAERRESERERWVGDAVKAFMQAQQSLNAGLTPSLTSAATATTSTAQLPSAAVTISPPVQETRAELDELRRLAVLLEERLDKIKARLDQLD